MNTHQTLKIEIEIINEDVTGTIKINSSFSFLDTPTITYFLCLSPKTKINKNKKHTNSHRQGFAIPVLKTKLFILSSAMTKFFMYIGKIK